MKIIVPATVEPITLAMARKQCKVDAEGSPPAHEDDDLLALFTTAAREWCEAYLGMTVAPAVVEIVRDAFPAGTLALESGPVLGVASVEYLDSTGALQTLSPLTYTLDTTKQVAVIRLVDGQAWPDAKVVSNAVAVRYVVGYSLPGDSPQDAPLPASVRVAMLLLIGHLYKNREDTIDANLANIPMGARALLSPIKLRRGFA